jgi:hypothetical protein
LRYHKSSIVNFSGLPGLGLDDYSTLHVLVHLTADCITGEREGSNFIGDKRYIGRLARLDAVA